MAEFKAKYTKEGEDEVIKVLLKSSKVTNCCCSDSDEELVIVYDWGVTNSNKKDLDTSTSTTWNIVGFENFGYNCPDEFAISKYMSFVGGDNTGINASEKINVT
jgi:hypothetical protein